MKAIICSEIDGKYKHKDRQKYKSGVPRLLKKHINHYSRG
jgi:hypothetical protein